MLVAFVKKVASLGLIPPTPPTPPKMTVPGYHTQRSSLERGMLAGNTSHLT